MALATIPIDRIEVGQRLREVSAVQVDALVASIGDIGLLNPITVFERILIRDGSSVSGYGVVAGAHRLEACKRLGLADIEANIVSLSDLERQIAECDENLCGTVLSASERAMFTKRRKDAYEALHPETKHGANQHTSSRQIGDSSNVERFTENTAKATGQSERVVQRDAERGEKVIDEVIDLIRGTKLDTGVYLDKLKKLTPNEQVTVAKRDLALLRQQNKAKPVQSRSSSKVDADVKSRAAREVAEMITEHVPGEWWDAIKSNLYAAGASNIANELTNMTGQSIMDRRFR